jgi:hypothetical protein
MRAVRLAAMALLSLVVLMALSSPRQAVAGAFEIPAATVSASAPGGDGALGPRATSLPGAEDATQAAINDILAETAVVLVSGAAAIVGLMRGRL